MESLSDVPIVLQAIGVFTIVMSFLLLIFNAVLDSKLESKLEAKTKTLRNNQKNLEDIFKEKHAESKINIARIEVTLKKENEKIKEIKTDLNDVLEYIKGSIKSDQKLLDHVKNLTNMVIQNKGAGK